MMLTLLVVLAASLQSAAGAVFESDLWPEEGRPVFEAVGPPLSLHEEPSVSSKVTRRLSVKSKQRLVFDQTRYRTVKPGRLTVLVATALKGRVLGDITRLSAADYYSGRFPAASVTLSAGDAIEYLQYRAEGTCFVRVDGKTIDAETCPAHENTQFRLDVEPSVEWWIHITISGKPAGWLLITDATVKEVDRQG
jgi:hypothetical protein